MGSFWPSQGRPQQRARFLDSLYFDLNDGVSLSPFRDKQPREYYPQLGKLKSCVCGWWGQTSYKGNLIHCMCVWLGGVDTNFERERCKVPPGINSENACIAHYYYVGCSVCPSYLCRQKHLSYLSLSLPSSHPVFVLNHASPDDFQPLSLREMHTELAANFQGAKVNIAGKCVCACVCFSNCSNSF